MYIKSYWSDITSHRWNAALRLHHRRAKAGGNVEFFFCCVSVLLFGGCVTCCWSWTDVASKYCPCSVLIRMINLLLVKSLKKKALLLLPPKLSKFTWSALRLILTDVLHLDTTVTEDTSSPAFQGKIKCNRTDYIYIKWLGKQLPIVPSSLGSPPAATGCSWSAAARQTWQWRHQWRAAGGPRIQPSPEMWVWAWHWGPAEWAGEQNAVWLVSFLYFCVINFSLGHVHDFKTHA